MILLAFVMVFGLAACGGGSGEEEGGADADQTAAFPVTVVDHLGRQVTIEEEPQTIVSGYYISTSMLIALNQQDKLVGIEAKANTRNIYHLSAPEVIELPSVGTAKNFDLETCASLDPDLVILPKKLKDVAQSLEELDIDVLFVNPEDQAQLEDAISIIGAATGSTEQAVALLESLHANVDAVKEAVASEEKPLVYMASNSALLSTAGPKMYQNTLIENAGGANAAQEIEDAYWAEISYEQILAWDPQYIILAADAEYTAADVLADANLAGCQAVVNKNVYQFPSTVEAWDSPVPGSAMGNLWLASVLHPEAYSAEDYAKAVTGFYEAFYRFTPEL